MFNELTENDIKKMQEEINYRIAVIRPKISQDIIEAKAHGDLSENAEYHAARKEKGRNEGRIEYLRAMIKTASVIKPNENKNEIGIFDEVEVFFVEDNEIETYKISTTMRNDASKGIISKESPLGKALMGKKVGDKIFVKVSNDYSYNVVIKSIKKCREDDIDLPLS